jgi:hypothetical protein
MRGETSLIGRRQCRQQMVVQRSAVGKMRAASDDENVR